MGALCDVRQLPCTNSSVFPAFSLKNLTYEIILTLGQAFEVAYQLALQAQRAKPLGAAAGETIETKSSKPVPKPRAGVRKSAVRTWSWGLELGFLSGTTCLKLPLGGAEVPVACSIRHCWCCSARGSACWQACCMPGFPCGAGQAEGM